MVICRKCEAMLDVQLPANPEEFANLLRGS
jgi:hypothetical protein